MSKKKTRLPSLRNQDWKTVKTKTEKINELLIHISTKNTTELNELIYAGANFVCEKNQCSPKEHEQKLKTRMGNSTGKADKKSTTYIDQHIPQKSKTWRKNLAMAWIDNKKCIWYIPAKLDNTLSQNVDDIRRNPKVYLPNRLGM